MLKKAHEVAFSLGLGMREKHSHVLPTTNSYKLTIKKKYQIVYYRNVFLVRKIN